ncbi:MAG: hypothetical protein KGH87_01005 [Thaumarchaeota archaeon]|nr:hypothetical protein [Nitrososphaerota archaeon]
MISNIYSTMPIIPYGVPYVAQTRPIVSIENVVAPEGKESDGAWQVT